MDTSIQRIVLVTVYAPKSVDPTEATVLTPVAGALHSDPFRIANIQGLSGYQPFLIEVQGRRGRVNVITKDVDVGPMSVRLADPKIAGGTMEQHWFTQFIGDLEGLDRLLECKVVIQESLDEGGTLPVYYTGRIKNARQSDGNEAVLSLVDVTRDAKFPAFTGGIVHPNVQAYAQRVPILPFINPQPWGAFAPGSWLSAIVRTPTLGFTRYIYSAQSDTPKIYNSTLTRHIYDLADRALVRMDGWLNPRAYLYFSPGKVLVRIQPVAGGGVYGYAWLRFITGLDDKDGQWHLDNLAVDEIPAGAPYYGIAFPAVGTAITWGLVPNNDPSEASPVLVNDVTAAKYTRDVLLGYYGPFRADGTPKHAVPVDSDSFTLLEADATIPLVREKITGRQADRLKYLADQVLKPRHLALEPTPAGAMRLVDMRPTSGLAALGPDVTITDDDLTDELEPEGWRSTSDDAIPVITATWYRDTQFPAKVIADGNDELPEVPGARIETAAIPLERLDIRPRALDFVKEPLKLDLKTVRASDTPVAGAAAVDKAISTAIQLADDLMAPFGAGGRYMTLVCKRVAKIEAFRLGDKCIVAVKSIADPFTKEWGSPVAAMVLENTERGPRRELSLLALGSVVVADVPTLGNIIQHPTLDQRIWTQQTDVALNAAGDPVVLEFNVTSPAVAVRPAETDAGWRRMSVITADGDYDVGPAAANRQVWTRARSEPGRSSFIGIPSAWVFPPNASVVTDGLPAPTAVAASELSGGSFLATVTPADVTLGVMWYLAVGAGVVLTQANAYAGPFQPGQTQVVLASLIPGTTYRLGAAHTDGNGGFSDITSIDVASGGAAVCPQPAGFNFVIPSSVWITLFPADPAFNFYIERAPDVAGSPGAFVRVISDWPGTEQLFIDDLPADGSTWWYQVGHSRPGWTDSAPLPAKSIVLRPELLGPDGTNPDIQIVPTMPTAAIDTTNDLTTGTLTLTLTDPDGRAKKVEFRNQPGATGVWSAWAQDASVPYLTTVAVADGKISKIGWRVIGNDATGKADQVLLSGERDFPGRGVSGSANFVLHTADDATIANARVLTASTEIGLDVATARQIKPTVIQVPTTKVKAPGGSTPGHVLKVQGDGTSIAPEAESVSDDGGMGDGTPGNLLLPFVVRSGKDDALVIGLHGDALEHIPAGFVRANLQAGAEVRGQATVKVAGFLTAYLEVKYSTDNGATWPDANVFDIQVPLGVTVPAGGVKHSVGLSAVVPAGAAGDVLMRAAVAGGNGVARPEIVNFLVKVTSAAQPPEDGEGGPWPGTPTLPTGVTWGDVILDLNSKTVTGIADLARTIPWNDDSTSNNDGYVVSGRLGGEFHATGWRGGSLPFVRSKASNYGWASPSAYPNNETLYILLDKPTGQGLTSSASVIAYSAAGPGENFVLRLQSNQKLYFSAGGSAFGTPQAEGTHVLDATKTYLLRVTHTRGAGNARVYLSEIGGVEGALDVNLSDALIVNGWFGTNIFFGEDAADGVNVTADWMRVVRYNKEQNVAGRLDPESAMLIAAGITP